MYSFKHRFILYLGIIFLIIVATVGTTMDAFAGLTETGPTSATATPVTLNGSDQTTIYTLPLSVTNTGSGSGNGWNLTITSTTFTAGTHTLSTSASVVKTTPTVSACTGGGCNQPTNTITYPLNVPAGTTFPTAVKLFNAATGTGKGTVAITPTITIAIPANTFAGTYTSTVDVAIVDGP